MMQIAKTPEVNLSLWEDDFVDLINKMVDFQQTALSTENFYFDKSGWLLRFESAVSPSNPLDPVNMASMVFYALEYLVSKELGDGIRDAKATDIVDALHGVIDLVYSKNRDYGNAALLPAVLVPWLDVRCGLLFRLSDKIRRLRRLYGGDTPEVAESLEDTLRDIVGYNFLLYSVIRTDEISGKETEGESREV